MQIMSVYMTFKSALQSIILVQPMQFYLRSIAGYSLFYSLHTVCFDIMYGMSIYEIKRFVTTLNLP